MRLCCQIPLSHFDIAVDTSFDARVTAIFGPSGSGKTTLLDAIAGLRAMTEGEITIGDKTLYSSSRRIDLPPRLRGIGYVPQEGALLPHLSVSKNILFGAKRTNASTAAKTIHLDHVIDVLEIRQLLGRSVATLSGGEAQRVALARAILSRPQLLLLDEPLAALDIGLKERILPYLARVRDEFAIPMIYVTHNLTEVLTLADWVLMMRQGKFVGQGLPKDTLHSVTALRLLSDEHYENVLTATLVESKRDAGTTRIRLDSEDSLLIPYIGAPEGSRVQVRVSADDILIATEQPRGLSASNILSGIIQRIESADGEVMILVRAGAEFYVSLTASAVERLNLKNDMSVFLIIKTRSFRVL